MKWLLMLLTVLSCARAFGGGELPFPFDSDTEMPMLSSHMYSVQGTSLTVQVKTYQDPKVANLQWAKVWIRGEQEFVFDREWGTPQGTSLAVMVHIESSKGKLQV